LIYFPFSITLLFGIDPHETELQLEKNDDTYYDDSLKGWKRTSRSSLPVYRRLRYDSADNEMSKVFKRGAAQISGELKSTVNRLLSKGSTRVIEPIRNKSIAVTSGKGGVGKTITAVNLSIYYARKGIATALVDLDPLSDIATLLDLVEAESALEKQAGEVKNAGLESLSIPVFKNLDLIFPSPKLKKTERSILLEKIYRDLPENLDSRYQLLVFDLPAGSEFEENLIFLPFMGMVLLVTNPEPTAHAAAGAYIKRAFDVYQDLTIHLWHNRYAPNTRNHFNPKDIVGNYNRNVPKELQIDKGNYARLRDFASVPEDPALNLLRGSPGADENVIRFLLDTLMFIHEERIATLAASTISNRSFELIRQFLSHHKTIGNIDEYLDEIGRYLRVLLELQLDALPTATVDPETSLSTAQVFTPEQRSGFRSFLQKLNSDPLLQRIVRTMDLLEGKLQRLEERKNPFAAGTAVVPDKAVDRELSALLVAINRTSQRNPLMANQGGLLLFYFSLYKLFQSQTVTELIKSLVPSKRNRKGSTVRDRHRQIRNLVEGDPEYKKRYLKLLKTLHPIVSKQIANIVKTFELSGLLLRDQKGTVIRSAYVKLLTNFIHDTLYSGLSVVVGFPFRAAASAFQEGAERTLQTLKQGA
jgi:MinD-like ATPase involved in chromosome partitioning or flagellar assembly